MKNVDGLDVLEGVKRIDPEVPVLLMTAFGGVESAVEAMRRGAFHYVTKPFELHALRALIERACRERALSRENALLRRTLRANLAARQILGASPAMQQLRALVERVASAASPALISGETGTGKELVALAIHADGPRADRPFVALNCAALPEHLLESELFGHARGAFTGAAQARRGLFVEAEGGTLFLDEVGDLPQPLQGKLLRVLQSGEVRPVGSEAVRTVDVRCIAATHKDLGQLVDKGLFREDLFFRLDVLRVPVPALHERARTSRSSSSTSCAEPRSLAALRAPWLRARGARLPAGAPLARQRPPAREPRRAPRRHGAGAARAPRRRPAGARSRARSRPALAPRSKAAHARASCPIGTSRPSSRRSDGSKQKAAEILGVDPSTLYRREKTRE